MEFGRKPLSLLELCVRKAIDNLRYMDSVDGVEMDLLKRILPHCTMEHLTKIESKTKMDISPVTDPLWKRFYQREFGQEHFNKVVKRLKDHGDRVEKYTWWQLFEARKKRQQEAEDEMVEKFTRKIQAEKAEKQSKQTKLCTKVPPSSKRSFFGGGGPSSLSNCSYKSPMLKKARMEADSRARLQSAIQRNSFARSSQPTRTTSFSGQPVRTTTIHRPNSTISITKPIGESRLQRPISTIAKPMGASKQIQNSTFTKPMGASRQIQNSTFTKPMGASSLQRPNLTVTGPMGASRQIQNSTFTKPMGASSLQRPNSTITSPMVVSRQIQNSTFTKPMGASSLQRPNSTITRLMGASRQIQNSRPKF